MKKEIQTKHWLSNENSSLIFVIFPGISFPIRWTLQLTLPETK